MGERVRDLFSCVLDDFDDFVVSSAGQVRLDTIQECVELFCVLFEVLFVYIPSFATEVPRRAVGTGVGRMFEQYIEGDPKVITQTRGSVVGDFPVFDQNSFSSKS